MTSARRPHWLVAWSICLLAITGCGDGVAGSSTANSKKLERLIQVETARDLLTDTGVPRPGSDDPGVRDAMDEIDVACGETGTRRYECRVGIGDATRVCAMGTDAAVTRVAWQRCGNDASPGLSEEYVDCDEVGHVAAYADPRDDVTDNRPPLDDMVTARDRITADLEEVELAVSADAICVSWNLARPVRLPVSVAFFATPEDVHNQRVALIGGLAAGEPPSIGDGLGGQIDGRIGIRGDSVSLAVERDGMPEAYWETLGSSFKPAAQVSHRVRGTPDRPYSYVDTLSIPVGGEPSYP